MNKKTVEKKVFLTGATGFIGSQVLEVLVRSGYHICALYRNEKKIPEQLRFHKKIDWVQGEFTDFTSWKEKISGNHIIINCVGIIREKKGSTFQVVHTDIPGHMMNEAQHAKVSHFIQISALGAGSDESIRYFHTKKVAEDFLVQSGIRYTIFRPSFVFSYNSEAMRLFRKLAMLPLTPVIAGGEYKFEPLFVGDLAQAVCESIFKKKSWNKIIEVGGAEVLTYKEILRMLARLESKNITTVSIPFWMAMPGVAIGQYFWFFPITVDQLKMLIRGSVCKNNEMQKIFSIQATSFEEGLSLSK
ncbi:MAG: complex I NDUFA9 subunit family protein [Leptospirales bacterium]